MALGATLANSLPSAADNGVWLKEVSVALQRVLVPSLVELLVKGDLHLLNQLLLYSRLAIYWLYVLCWTCLGQIGHEQDVITALPCHSTVIVSQVHFWSSCAPA